MPTDTYGVAYPSPLDAPDGAAQMMAMVSTFSSRLVQYVVDEAERDAKFGSSTDDLVVVTTTAPWKVWVRTGTGPADWLRIWYDTGWVTSGFTNGPNWDVSGDSTRARNLNGSIEVMVQGTRSTNINGGVDGNIGDETVCTIPPQFAPDQRARNVLGRYTGIAIGYISTAGNLVLSAIQPGLSGGGFSFNASYQEG